MFSFPFLDDWVELTQFHLVCNFCLLKENPKTKQTKNVVDRQIHSSQGGENKLKQKLGSIKSLQQMVSIIFIFTFLMSFSCHGYTHRAGMINIFEFVGNSNAIP